MDKVGLAVRRIRPAADLSFTKLESISMKTVGFLLALLLSHLAQAAPCLIHNELPAMIKCAEEGDAVSQYLLGEIYLLGKEVPKDYAKSFIWTSKAAMQGEKGAQARLGFDYYNGWGTSKNRVLAYKWWSLASVGNDDPLLRKNMDRLESELSPSELASAQKAATEFAERKSRKK